MTLKFNVRTHSEEMIHQSENRKLKLELAKLQLVGNLHPTNASILKPRNNTFVQKQKNTMRFQVIITKCSST